MFHSGYTDKETNQFVLKILKWTVLGILFGLGLLLSVNTFAFYISVFCGFVSLVFFIYGKIKGRF